MDRLVQLLSRLRRLRAA